MLTFGTLQRRAPGGPESRTSMDLARGGERDEGSPPAAAEKALRSPGQPLAGGLRAVLEPRFARDFSRIAAAHWPEEAHERNADEIASRVLTSSARHGQDASAPPATDFSRVRVHTDAEAAESARALQARAYTVDSHIVFAPGEYAPATRRGLHLLAHELTHVVQQSQGAAVLQRSPAPFAKTAKELELPWSGRGFSLFEMSSRGIRVLVAVRDEKVKAVRAAVPSIAARIAADSALIADATQRVMTCFIASTTTRFAHFEGEPVLMLDPTDANAETAAHEMGHAVFQALKLQGESKAKGAPAAAAFRIRIAHVYNLLADSKLYTQDGETHPAGLWIVDPSQWKPGSAREHPWDDPDEFFASAKEAYQSDRAGLRRSIARFVKFDSKLRASADELMQLLDDFLGAGKLAAKPLSASETKTATAALSRGTGVSKVEDTLAANTALNWLVDPTSRPVEEKAGPSVTPPRTRPVPTRRPNMVTGPGGVKERLEKQFEQRLREKVLESAEELP